MNERQRRAVGVSSPDDLMKLVIQRQNQDYRQHPALATGNVPGKTSTIAAGLSAVALAFPIVVRDGSAHGTKGQA
ncbi:Uncharacterised protein [Mycobacteroides abscessus subsp. abscessus]|uniref:hypothetical protein n=1 Tax=Mycobacteroides abscessus TaxID=36809 RepID=UPI0009280D37|nr:hypothetical protein [Mycobacteroides abscessus]SIA43963.1 Uncharacterised protein [Mycobacteroides abscessus subsp. abscessus]SIA55108.1 Uncharacterised protein [Mycobacteroides abscessus subsp. abscessus]